MYIHLKGKEKKTETAVTYTKIHNKREMRSCLLCQNKNRQAQSNRVRSDGSKQNTSGYNIYLLGQVQMKTVHYSQSGSP